MNRIDSHLETRILALIARGDSYDDIIATVAKDGESITKATLVNIKKRNNETLKYMQGALVQHELNKSTQILARSRQLLEKKLQRALEVDHRIDELKEMRDNDEISPQEYYDMVKLESKNDISTSVLISLSKEMFNQSQLEQNKPTSISESPAEARKNLETLLDAIKDKDERKMVESIFPDAKPHPISS